MLARLANFLHQIAEGGRPGAQPLGRVVVIPAVNVLGLNTRTRLWPFDGTDVNRMFPGYGAGETTQRIAHAVLEATAGAEWRVDVHSSNVDFEELPQVRLYDPEGLRRQPLLCEGDLVARVLTRQPFQATADTFLEAQGQ